MKIPLWKKYLSYLFEMHVESAPSDLHPHLYVSVNKGRYQLSTANAIYSHADLYGNFRMAFDHLNWEKLKGDQALILGFGLGSIPFMLEKIFKKSFEYTAIEPDENVMYLAQKYVLPELTAHLNFHLVGAEQFIYMTEQKFDLICMDVFVDDIIPMECQSLAFCEALKESLNPNGILVFNRLSRNEKDLKQTKAYFNKMFQKVFPNGVYLDVKGNWMLTNEKENFKK